LLDAAFQMPTTSSTPKTTRARKQGDVRNKAAFVAALGLEGARGAARSRPRRRASSRRGGARARYCSGGA
jgi:hypothetical protein